MTPEKCQCESAGACPILRRECDPLTGRMMSEVRHSECKNKPHYFEMFLGETQNPCRGSIQPPKPIESDWNQSPCKHLGEVVDSVFCESCGGNSVNYPVRECAIYGLCTERHRDDVIDFCYGCRDYKPAPEIPASPEMPIGHRHFSTWAVGITTAPRSQHRTLPECVQSVKANGWNPLIFAEPNTDLSGIDCEVIQRQTRLGVWHNWRTAARELLDRFPDAEMILTIQDDTVFHPQSRWYAEHNFPLKPNRVYSLYTPKHYGQIADVFDGTGKQRQNKIPYESARKWLTKTRIKEGWKLKSHNKPVGLHRIKTGSLWGACAMVFPRKVLESILSHKIAQTWIGHRGKMDPKKWRERQTREPWRIQNSDTAIGKILALSGFEYWCVVPSLTEHIALASADGVNHGDNGGRRNAAWFAAGDLREIFK